MPSGYGWQLSHAGFRHARLVNPCPATLPASLPPSRHRIDRDHDSRSDCRRRSNGSGPTTGPAWCRAERRPRARLAGTAPTAGTVSASPRRRVRRAEAADAVAAASGEAPVGVTTGRGTAPQIRAARRAAAPQRPDVVRRCTSASCSTPTTARPVGPRLSRSPFRDAHAHALVRGTIRAPPGSTSVTSPHRSSDRDAGCVHRGARDHELAPPSHPLPALRRAPPSWRSAAGSDAAPSRISRSFRAPTRRDRRHRRRRRPHAARVERPVGEQPLLAAGRASSNRGSR